MQKGMNYMSQNGRQLEKINFNQLCAHSIDEMLYPILKLHPNIICLQFNKGTMIRESSKAIGKVLADFKHIRELDISGCGLAELQGKDIADGLMRAKQLEVLKCANNA